MLVLSRLEGERIVLNPAGERVTLDGPITLQLLYVGGNHVRLGVTAPREIVILREELVENPREELVENPGRQAGGLGQTDDLSSRRNSA